MGPEPRPLLPRWEPFVVENAVRSIGWGVIPCNWMQCMENSLDQTHVEYLHRKFDNYVLERLGRTDLKHDVRHHAKIGFDVFEYGIVKRRVWQGGTENDPEWRLGHPILFPNILANSSQTLQYRVPIDDEHTLHWWYNARAPKDGSTVRQDSVPLYEVPIPGLDARGRPTWSTLDNNSGQDMLMWYTQGPVADRSDEKLGTADKGIILYRQLLQRSIEEVQRGDDPLGVIRDPAKNVNIHIVSEYDEGGIAERRIRGVGDRRPAGTSAKYDPTLSGKTDREMDGVEMVKA
jgi:5,5'-dehydrodivanillate O-demethylase